MELLVRILAPLNFLASAAARVALAPIGWLPPWLSLLLVSIISACGILIVFKYTSNQRAIRRVRDSIKANLLAVRLFNQSPRVTFRAQGALLAAAGHLLLLAIIPVFVMLLPMTLLISQLAAWYEMAPLRPKETTVVFAKLRDRSVPLEGVSLTVPDGCTIEVGPLPAPEASAVAWRIQTIPPGYHTLKVQADGQTFTKQLAVGDPLMRVSSLRPARDPADVLLHPCEQPFAADAAVQSIEVQYEPRKGWATGAGRWLITWFLLSMLAAFALRRFFNVQF